MRGVLATALAVVVLAQLAAASEDGSEASSLLDCQQDLVSCLNGTGAFFEEDRRKKRSSAEDPVDITCGCSTSSTGDEGETTDCSCMCQCFNQYYDCYYNVYSADMTAAFNSLEDEIIAADSETGIGYNITDYSADDCAFVSDSSSSEADTTVSSAGQGGVEESSSEKTKTSSSSSTVSSSEIVVPVKASSSYSEEKLSGKWCYFQFYGDPHLVKTYDGKNFIWWSCMKYKFTNLYTTSRLSLTAVGDNLDLSPEYTYATSVSLTIRGTVYTVEASTMKFSPSTPPSGVVFGKCNRTVTNTPLTLLTGRTCIAMYSSSGEFMAFIQDGDTSTGYFLMVELYGICEGSGNLQKGEYSCPSTRRGSSRQLSRRTTTSALCTGLTGPYSEFCNFDVSTTSVDSSSTSSWMAAKQSAQAASYIQAVKSVTGLGAAAAGLSTAAIVGIAVGATVAGVAVVGATTAGVVHVVRGRNAEARTENALEVEKKKPAGAGPNVMDLDPKAHSSITARAPPVAV